MPSLVRYGSDTGIADEQLRKRLLETPLAFLEFETGLSRHTIVRARRGEPVHARSLQLLKNVVRQHLTRGVSALVRTSVFEDVTGAAGAPSRPLPQHL